MEVSFANDDLDRLETDPKFDAKLSQAIVRKFRQRMQSIRAAEDERTFYGFKSWHFEQLQGRRSHQRSIKLNDQWRLVIEIVEGKPKNSVKIVSIEDYHKG